MESVYCLICLRSRPIDFASLRIERKSTYIAKAVEIQIKIFFTRAILISSEDAPCLAIMLFLVYLSTLRIKADMIARRNIQPKVFHICAIQVGPVDSVGSKILPIYFSIATRFYLIGCNHQSNIEKKEKSNCREYCKTLAHYN